MNPIQDQSKRVAIYGGAFDPIHEGHLQMARYAVQDAGHFDEVWLVPCAIHRFSKDMAPWKERMEMCRIGVLGENNIKASDFEFRKQLKGSSFELMESLTHEPDYRRMHFSLLIGEDNAKNIHLWKKAKELKANYSIAVVPRKGELPTLKKAWYQSPPHIYFSKAEGIPELSSTQIRETLKKGETGKLQKSLKPEILAYIISRNLYGTQK